MYINVKSTPSLTKVSHLVWEPTHILAFQEYVYIHSLKVNGGGELGYSSSQASHSRSFKASALPLIKDEKMHSGSKSRQNAILF